MTCGPSYGPTHFAPPLDLFKDAAIGRSRGYRYERAIGPNIATTGPAISVDVRIASPMLLNCNCDRIILGLRIDTFMRLAPSNIFSHFSSLLWLISHAVVFHPQATETATRRTTRQSAVSAVLFSGRNFRGLLRRTWFSYVG